MDRCDSSASRQLRSGRGIRVQVDESLGEKTFRRVNPGERATLYTQLPLVGTGVALRT
jgi:hypothetical protein